MSKVIVITGAGVGLGRALARRFAADGDTVVLLGRTLSKVEAVAAEIGDRAMAVGCDVASPDSVRAAFAEIAKRHP
ncbi:MAG TPA: SDR family NAD(P)-dependent oxidoreductase, partial [Porticoccaceae bacterium]